MRKLRMHAGIAREYVKNVLAGVPPPSPAAMRQNLPWVSEGERHAYAFIAACLGGLYAARNALPPNVKAALFAAARDIKPERIPQSFLSHYQLPDSPAATGSGFELYVFKAKRHDLPDLGIMVQKNTDDASLTLESLRGGYDLHKRLLPEFTPWQATQYRDLGGKKEHLIRVAEYVTILQDIAVGHEERDLVALQSRLHDLPKGAQASFARFVEELAALEARGMYLDIGGKNNVVLCQDRDGNTSVRILDTGLIGLAEGASREDRDMVRASGIKVAEVKEHGGGGSWNARMYRAYVARLQQIAASLR